MTMMANIEKVNAFNFDDAVNTSYIPASTSRAETNDTRNFMDEFEKVAADNQKDLEIKKKGEQNLVNPPENNESRKDNRVNPEKDRKTGEKIDREGPGPGKEKVEETGPRENRKDEKPKENEKTGGNSKNKNEKTDGSGKNNNEKIENSPEYPEEKKINNKHIRLGKDMHYNTRTIKEVIQKNQLQRAEMIKIKEEIKENFSESKKINTTDHVEKMMVKDQVTGSGSEEKGIKNKLVDHINSRLDKTGEVKPGDEQTNKGLNTEKKQVREPDANKNDGKSFFANELKLQKNDGSQEKQPNFNLLNDLSRNIQQLNGIKVKQVFNQQDFFEQYRVFQEKVVNHVENSIKFLISSGESRAVIQLHPPELGRVQMELVVHDNQVTAKINTENAAVKEVILANLDQLKSNLANAGTQINKFDVEVGGFKNYFEQHFSKGGSGRAGQQRSTGNEPSPDSNELMLDQVINQQALNFYLGRRINCLI